MDLYKNAQNTDIESLPVYDENTELGSIFCLTRGDITKLKADAYAISNSASRSFYCTEKSTRQYLTMNFSYIVLYQCLNIIRKLQFSLKYQLLC